MAATPKRYYEFVGVGSLESLFSQYKDRSQHCFVEVPGLPAISALDFYRRPNGKAAAFGWLTAAGVYTGSLLFGAQGPRDSVVYDSELIAFPSAAALRAVRTPSRLPKQGNAAAKTATAKAAAAAASGTPLSPSTPESSPLATSPGVMLPPSFGGNVSAGPPDESPVGLALSEFHVLLLYPSCVAAVSRLSRQPVCVAVPPTKALLPLVGLSHDTSRSCVWVWGKRGVMRLLVSREERHVWRLHLEAGDFETALSYCSPTEPSQRDAVLSAQADHEFSRGAYELAALQLAKTRRPLEEVALRFIGVGQQAALRTFLLHRLDSIADEQSSQLALLCTWLCELYLLELSQLRRASEEEEAAAVEFRAFLGDKQRHLNRSVTYALLEAHGRDSELRHFATLCADWERLILLHLQQRQPMAALKQLQQLLANASNTVPLACFPGAHVGADFCGCFSGNLGSRASIGVNPGIVSAEQAEMERLLRIFAFELLEMAPTATVDLWISCPFLEPLSLLPALIRYDELYSAANAADSTGAQTPPPPHEGIRYLEHCVSVLQSRKEVLHNYLVLLHARRSPDAALLHFLRGSTQPDPHEDIKIRTEATGATADADADPLAWHGASLPLYDTLYALRVCHDYHRHTACVILYQRLGKLEEAVGLALEREQLELAKQSAGLAAEDGRRKKLWLQIGRHILGIVKPSALARQASGATDSSSGEVLAAAEPEEQRARVRQAVQLMQECPLLRIEDLLPCFPDFAIIDDFKDQIVAAVETYSAQLKALRQKMHATIQSSEALRRDIKRMRERPPLIPVHNRCDCTLLAPISVPTCRGSALDAHQHVAFPCGHAFRVHCLLQTLPDSERERLTQLDASAFEEALCAECPLCGEAMVQSIAKGFIDEELEGPLIESWVI